MKTVLIMRHGKSSWRDQSLTDYDRPLKKRGKYDSPKMGEFLMELDLIPDKIISSSAKRARQTARLLADSCGYQGEITFKRSLYHGFTSDYLDLIRSTDDSCSTLLVIGHNPGLEELLYELTDQSEWLPTAAVARVSLEISHWSEITDYTEGELTDVWRPRDLL